MKDVTTVERLVQSILRVNDRVLICMVLVDGCDFVSCINEMA